jgi:hypothetical protein
LRTLITLICFATYVQGGNELCRIEGFDRRKAISELKVSIEAEVGLVHALTRLINLESLVELQDHLTMKDAGMPNEQALAAGVIQLYAQKLKKIVVADELQITPGEVTDSELAVLCDSIRDGPPDVLVLSGCRRVTNISCLVQLSMISHLDVSSCSLGVQGGCHLADVIKDMGALSMTVSKKCVPAAEFDLIPQKGQRKGQTATYNGKEVKILKAFEDDTIDIEWDEPKDRGELLVLNLASNDLGVLVLPEGWSKGSGQHDGHGYDWYKHTNGADQKEHPGKAEGIIALANAIPDMGALMKFDISMNNLYAAGAKALAEGLRGNQFMTELNLAGNEMGKDCGNRHAKADMSGITALADVIPGMGAICTLTFGNKQAVTMTTEMTEANFSGKLYSHEAQIVAAFLPKCT